MFKKIGRRRKEEQPSSPTANVSQYNNYFAASMPALMPASLAAIHLVSENTHIQEFSLGSGGRR